MSYTYMYMYTNTGSCLLPHSGETMVGPFPGIDQSELLFALCRFSDDPSGWSTLSGTHGNCRRGLGDRLLECLGERVGEVLGEG